MSPSPFHRRAAESAEKNNSKSKKNPLFLRPYILFFSALSAVSGLFSYILMISQKATKRWLRKKLQMQGAQKLRSEAH
jgi:hypothetical protein